MLDDNAHTFGVRAEGEVSQNLIVLRALGSIFDGDRILVSLDQAHI